jgi:hypothetical protein
MDLRAPFAFGDRVKIDGGDVVGRVTSFQFRSDRDCTIEVSYIHNGIAYAPWVESWRLTPA